MSGVVRPATVDDRRAILEACRRRPWFSAPTRAYGPDVLGAKLTAALDAHIDTLLDHPQFELLVHAGEQLHGWAILRHEVDEAVTGKIISMIHDPSWIDSPALLEEAALRAARRGSVRLGIDVYVDDTAQAAACRSAGLAPEYHRIVCDLDRAPAPRPGSDGADITVQPALVEDRLFLLALSTECVPFMFCADRKEEIELVRMRFFDVYGLLDLAGNDDLRVWIARVSGEPAGAMHVRTQAATAADEGEEAYIFDISVLPEHWGGRVAVAIVDHVIQEMRARGIKYMTGDISIDNTRVLGLSKRFAFSPEYTRHFRKLGGLQ